MSDNQKKAKPIADANTARTKTEETADASQKSKADLRRERRELQEAQRAKKAGSGPATTTTAQKSNENTKQQANQAKQPAQAASKQPQSTNKPTSAQTTDASTKQPNTNAVVVESSFKPNSAESKTATTVETETGGQLPRNDSFVMAPVTLKLTKKKDKQPNAPDSVESTTKLKLFHHFEQYNRDYSATEKYKFDNPSVHPAFIRLGIQSAHEKINGSNSRCLAFLQTFKKFLHDYKEPKNDKKSISEDLESELKLNVKFLSQCRPLCISMGNAIKELKQVILHLPKEITESEAKEILNDEIDKFIHEKIVLAAETISKYMLAHSDIIISGTSYAKSKITNDDCLLVYGNSSLVTHILLEASTKFPNMHVIVVDSRPKYKGKQTIEKLIKHDIKCTYVLINAISFIMNKVTKVLLGAHALLANNYVVSNIGTSQIALVAKSFNVPVVVCCETYKFCDKVQTDAFVNNELGNPLDLLHQNSIESNNVSLLTESSIDGTQNNNITLLNLTYDVTPPDLISCVVTDMGMLPCTSVPVVLRLKNRDNNLPGISTNKKNSIDTDKTI